MDRGSSGSASKVPTIVVDISNRICSSVAKPESLISSLMHHFVVLLTFGIAFPPLGFVITVSLVTSVVFWQALIGRYIQFYNDRTNLLQTTGGTVAPELLALQYELVDAWKGSRSSARIITVSSSVFFGLFFFDITAGEIGWNQAFAFPVALVLGPLLFFRVVKSAGVVGSFNLPIVGQVVISKAEEDEGESTNDNPPGSGFGSGSDPTEHKSSAPDTPPRVLFKLKPSESETERPSFLYTLGFRPSRNEQTQELEITPRNTTTSEVEAGGGSSVVVVSPLYEQ